MTITLSFPNCKAKLSQIVNGSADLKQEAANLDESHNALFGRLHSCGLLADASGLYHKGFFLLQ